MYRICCPYCYKKKEKKRADEEAERRKSAELDMPRISRKSVAVYSPYSTISQLTNATVITEPPPPVFAKFVLRKSVDRLNSEVWIDVLFSPKYHFVFLFSFVLLMNFDHDLKNLKIKNMTKLSKNVLVEEIFSKNNCERVRCSKFTYFFLVLFFLFY